MNVEVADKQKAMEEIERHFPAGRSTSMDGVSISFDDFWFNVRPSNTEPLLRVRLEARTAGMARRKRRKSGGSWRRGNQLRRPPSPFLLRFAQERGHVIDKLQRNRKRYEELQTLISDPDHPGPEAIPRA